MFKQSILKQSVASGVPLGPASRGVQVELQSAAKVSGLQVNSALIEQGSDLYSALTELAEDSQAFLLLPDPVVAQRGALLALYATPMQLGEEAADWIRKSWAKGAFRLGPPRYPKHFSIDINRTVARSLEIDLPSEASLSRQLEAMP